MLQQLYYFIFISFSCILWGIPAALSFRQEKKADFFWFSNSLGLLCFMFGAGLLTLSLFGSVLCLLIPLAQAKFFVTVILPLLILILFRKPVKQLLLQYSFKLSFTKIETVFLFLIIILFLILGAGPHANNDTHIYHVQLVKWAGEYGTVPGLANLFPRFGTGSNWFNLISLFDISPWHQKNYSWLNTTFTAWFFLWLFNNWKLHSNSGNTASKVIMSHFYFIIFLFCLLEWELFRDAASSTNYDFAVTAFTLVAITYLIESCLSGNANKFSFCFCIICFSVIPFKFSGIFALMLVAYHLFASGRFKYWLYCGAAGIIILLPLVIKNYLVSGYPLFPLSFSFNSPDWQLPVEMTNYYKQYIQVSNRFYNSYRLNFTQTPELMQKDWIIPWLNGLLLQQKIILFATLSSLSIFLAKRIHLKEALKLKIIFALLIVMDAGWFLTAPSPRFGYAALLVLGFFPFCYWAGKYIPLQIHKPVLIIAVFISGYYSFKKASVLLQRKENFVNVIPIQTPSSQKIIINNIEYNLPDYFNSGWMRDCYDTGLPCIYQQNKYLQPRGKTLKEGFKMEPKPDSIFIRNYIY